MFLPEFSFEQITAFLNGPFVLGAIILFTALFGAIITLILFYHWAKYHPRAAFKLDSQEKVIRIFRKHWFMFLLDFLLMVILALLPMLAFFLPAEWFSQIKAFIGTLYLAWLVFIFFGILIVGTNYFLDTWILTNKRLIDVEQKSLFRRDIAELPLDNIEDIRIEVLGIIPSLLGIGNVHIQSAGAAKEFLIRNAARPEEAKNLISETYHKKLEEVKKVEIVG